MIEENDPAIRFGETVDAQFPAEQEKKATVSLVPMVFQAMRSLAQVAAGAASQEPKARR